MNAPINTQRLAAVEQSIALTKDLVDNFYVPDLLGRRETSLLLSSLRRFHIQSW